MKPAAIGFRAHSGWAALVAIAGPEKAPFPIERRRIELIAQGTPRQPFHAAEKLPLDEAIPLIEYSINEARSLAVTALHAVTERLARDGFKIVSAGLPTGSGHATSDLAAVLASHALIHTAEGELFREALAYASQSCGFKLTKVREKDIFTVAEERLRIAKDRLEAQLNDMRHAFGPPWTQDQKLAALAAWISR